VDYSLTLDATQAQHKEGKDIYPLLGANGMMALFLPLF
jgi:hypothetical protein